MKLLTDEYEQFMTAVQKDHNINGDKYVNCDPEAALRDHFNLDPQLAKQIYDEWIRLVFMRMPWRPPDE